VLLTPTPVRGHADSETTGLMGLRRVKARGLILSDHHCCALRADTDNGLVCALLACKDHVNLFLYDGAIVPDPDNIITGGHDNKTARTISFYSGSMIARRPLTTMLRQIAANNRAGGWRKIKQQR